MQTFLPFPDFGLSSCCLDDERLDKQIREALTIYKMIETHIKGWNVEPVCKMWYGYKGALVWYHNTSVSTWNHRGFPKREMLSNSFPIIFPHWVGDWKFHRSHQSNLLKKNEPHYRIWFGPAVPKNLDLVWPMDRRRVVRKDS